MLSKFQVLTWVIRTIFLNNKRSDQFLKYAIIFYTLPKVICESHHCTGMDRPKLKRKHPIPIIQVPLGIVRIRILIGKNNWHVETCRNKLSKKSFNFYVVFFCAFSCRNPVAPLPSNHLNGLSFSEKWPQPHFSRHSSLVSSPQQIIRSRQFYHLAVTHK